MSQFFDPLAGLNDAQKQAVECTEGPVLVLAGAGSGKTRVLAHRIAHIIGQGLANPWQILAVTFTNKAARELRDRVAMIANGGERVAAGTFHSTFARMLRVEAEALGYPKDFTIFDSDDSQRLIKMIMKDFNAADYRPKLVQSVISNYKNDMIPPDMALETANLPKEKEFAAIYDEYEKRLKKNGAMDFDDLLVKPVILFQNYPAILHKWSAQWQYLHVDEYQDTNKAQFELLKILGGPKPNLCVVGDDDQSIYSWRGARVENIFKFKDVFKDVKTFRLEQNYRSTQPILDVAHAIVVGSSRREEKKLWTNNKGLDLPTIMGTSSGDMEVSQVLDKIRRNVMSGKRSYNEHAILYRINAQSAPFEKSLIKFNIPYQIIGGMAFFQRKEIKDSLAYLKLCINPRDDISILRILKEPPRGIGDTTVVRLRDYQLQNDISLFEAFGQANLIDGLSTRAATLCKKFYDQIQSWIEASKYEDPALWAEKVLKESGYIERLDSEDKFTAETRHENIKVFLQEIKKESEQEGSVVDFLERASLATDSDKYAPEEDSVKLMTLHAAKGLEFPVVFVTGLDNGYLPFYSEGGVRDKDEERRLFYVGVTRAEQDLFITYSSYRDRWGGYEIPRGASEFLKEIPEDKVNLEGFSPWQRSYGNMSLFGDDSFGGHNSRSSSIKDSVSSRPATSAAAPSVARSRASADEIPAIHVGDLVEHKVYGQGIILKIANHKSDQKVTVSFNDGNHNFLQSKAKLQPVKDFK